MKTGPPQSVAAVPTTTSSVDANDRLTSDSYDASGNTVGSGSNTYQYDFENRLVKLNAGTAGEVRYVYDGDCNRVAKTAGGVTIKYLVDTLNPTGYAQVVEEIVGGSAQRVYGLGVMRVSQQQVVSGNWQTSFYGYDGHGSVRQLTDGSGVVTDTYTYDAFGNLISRTGTTANDYLYVGEQLDAALGMYYLRARYMYPSAGRFWTMDSFGGFNDDPVSTHKYLYASANPANEKDPSGYFVGTATEQVATLSARQALAYITITGIAANVIVRIKLGNYLGLKTIEEVIEAEKIQQEERQRYRENLKQYIDTLVTPDVEDKDRKRPRVLFHYTTRENAISIYNSATINQSIRGTYGLGAYATEIAPYDPNISRVTCSRKLYHLI